MLSLSPRGSIAADLEQTIPDEGTVVEIIAPRLATEVTARWPSAEALHEAGYALGATDEMVRVMLSIRVNEAGRIDRVGVYDSNDPGDLYNSAALEAARTAHYHPGRQGKAEREMWTLLCIDFPSVEASMASLSTDSNPLIGSAK